VAALANAANSVAAYNPPPIGYGVRLGHRAGTALGSFNGSVMRGTLGSRGLIVGTVRADNPANHVTSECARGLHEDVWILEFALAGSTYRWPMYVDRVRTGREADYASARMVLCFASPYVPPPQGSRESLSVIGLLFGVSGVFTNPNTAGVYPWNAIFVPYVRGAGTLNTDLAAQSTSHARLPVELTATAKRQKRGNQIFALVTACLRESGEAARGIRVAFYRQRTRRDVPVKVRSSRSNARGCVTMRVRITSKVMLVHAVFMVPRARKASGCTPTLAPRCSEATMAQPQNPVRVLRVRR
jgi:hypothetical protein